MSQGHNPPPPPLDKRIERVDHPLHYGGGDHVYETIKVLEAWLTPEEFIGFCKGNAIDRELLEKTRTPPWADKRKIARVYKEARRRGLTVDHEIPLKGRTVSGLHVENNLRIISRAANARKGNKFEGITT